MFNRRTIEGPYKLKYLDLVDRNYNDGNRVRIVMIGDVHFSMDNGNERNAINNILKEEVFTAVDEVDFFLEIGDFVELDQRSSTYKSKTMSYTIDTRGGYMFDMLNSEKQCFQRRDVNRRQIRSENRNVISKDQDGCFTNVYYHMSDPRYMFDLKTKVEDGQILLHREADMLNTSSDPTFNDVSVLRSLLKDNYIDILLENRVVVLNYLKAMRNINTPDIVREIDIIIGHIQQLINRYDPSIQYDEKLHQYAREITKMIEKFIDEKQPILVESTIHSLWKSYNAYTRRLDTNGRLWSSFLEKYRSAITPLKKGYALFDFYTITRLFRPYGQKDNINRIPKNIVLYTGQFHIDEIEKYVDMLFPNALIRKKEMYPSLNINNLVKCMKKIEEVNDTQLSIQTIDNMRNKGNGMVCLSLNAIYRQFDAYDIRWFFNQDNIDAMFLQETIPDISNVNETIKIDSIVSYIRSSKNNISNIVKVNNNRFRINVDKYVFTYDIVDTVVNRALISSTVELFSIETIVNGRKNGYTFKNANHPSIMDHVLSYYDNDEKVGWEYTRQWTSNISIVNARKMMKREIPTVLTKRKQEPLYNDEVNVIIIWHI